jgi:hypothetical protein
VQSKKLKRNATCTKVFLEIHTKKDKGDVAKGKRKRVVDEEADANEGGWQDI